jgi:curved DNA-binding protein
VAPHPDFERKGDDLQTSVSVDLYTLLLGGNIEVRTLGKTVRLDIPPETQNLTRFRLRKLGMPKLNQKNERGDLYARVNAILPENLSEKEQKEFAALQKLRQSN